MLERISKEFDGKLPQGAQQRVAEECGVSKAFVSKLTRQMGLQRRKSGRPGVEDAAKLAGLGLAPDPALRRPRKPLTRTASREAVKQALRENIVLTAREVAALVGSSLPSVVEAQLDRDHVPSFTDVRGERYFDAAVSGTSSKEALDEETSRRAG